MIAQQLIYQTIIVVCGQCDVDTCHFKKIKLAYSTAKPKTEHVFKLVKNGSNWSKASGKNKTCVQSFIQCIREFYWVEDSLELRFLYDPWKILDATKCIPTSS
jgi:hypothetical protein